MHHHLCLAAVALHRGNLSQGCLLLYVLADWLSLLRDAVSKTKGYSGPHFEFVQVLADVVQVLLAAASVDHQVDLIVCHLHM